MSDQPDHDGAQRFGGEFGPSRGANTTGVSLSTFKAQIEAQKNTQNRRRVPSF